MEKKDTKERLYSIMVQIVIMDQEDLEDISNYKIKVACRLPFYLNYFVFCLACGNKITSRIFGVFVSSITNLSIPIPIPPVGGIPYSNASTKSMSISLASSSPFSFCFN